jgi:hypothetical protein
MLPKKLDLALRSRQLAGLERHHLGGLNGTHNPRHLAVCGGEVVVPEQRHLFLERTLRVHHPEQPALSRVLDAGIRRELPTRGDPHVLAIAYLGIDLVRLKLEVEELRGQDRSREGGQPG